MTQPYWSRTPPHWTRDAPTQPGYYWHRDSEFPDRSSLIAEKLPGNEFHFVGTDEVWCAAEFHGVEWWSEAIKEPE